MAVLGDVSVTVTVADIEGSMGVSIPAWPDVSQAIPDQDYVPPATGGFPGYFSFS